MANGVWYIRASDLKYNADYSIYYTKSPVNAKRKESNEEETGFKIAKAIRLDIDIPVLNSLGTDFGKTGVFEFNFDPHTLEDESLTCPIDEQHTVSILTGIDNGQPAVVISFVNDDR